ncbi:HAMP domain-containing histidine kinase [Sporosarcina sp. ACRSL]|uniref:sensor histidine kinase n=1 Tax=Sporosarcina sp. ACRSL TaxID=2918215 RepID=UPI001EF55FE0|nr:HAMP domain-containing sensor histidine kinase [Sporosarcina sp. ACRSL]MCG7346167.1 HAMP domain-containing histidine kinase [Sporosarcina sp. ACRSL]
MNWTIRKKFFVGFLLLFSVAAFLFNFVLANMLEIHTTSNLESRVNTLQYATKQYMKQYEQLHKQDGNFFTVDSYAIANELSKIHAQSVALYDTAGQFLYEAAPIDQPLIIEHQRYQTNVDNESSEELIQAFQNKSAYTIQPVSNGTLLYFAFPLYIDTTFHGVIRFTADYTDVFQHNKRLISSFTLLTVLLFLGVFIISLFILNQLTKPLHNLTNATKQMAQGDYQPIPALNRTDEVGKLAKHFKLMQHEIQQHIQTVELEKEKVMLLEEKRRVFFNNVTHELKTPLATISGYAQIIGEKDFDDAAFLSNAALKIRSESDRLNEMVTQLLALSKYQSKTPTKLTEVIDLFPLVQSIAEDMQIKTTQHDMNIVVSGDPYFILGNENEIKQLFINLIDNAIQHGKLGHDINIEVRDHILIRNSCSPVPPTILKHIFEPFIHRKKEGSTGLGLFICANIVDRHKGTIKFEEVSGQAVVAITIPRWQHDGNNYYKI